MKKLVRVGIFVCMLLLIAVNVNADQSSEKKGTEERKAVLTKATDLLTTGDSFKAIEYVQSLGDSPTVAQVYSYLVIDLYNAKNIRGMITLGRAGIQYCLTKSQETYKENAQKANWFRTNAQIMSFNLAANTWPGWGDAGIVLTKDDMAFGLDLAQLDLRLASELNYPPLKISNSYWIIGAQFLAAKKYNEALVAFENAKKKALETGDPDQLWMIKGYVAITKILAGKKDGQTHFEDAVKTLRASKGENASFYADQLDSVLKIFTAK